MKSDSDDKKKKTQPGNGMAVGIALGLAIGAGIGVAMGNIAIGIGVGLAIGAAIGAAMEQKNKGRTTGVKQVVNGWHCFCFEQRFINPFL